MVRNAQPLDYWKSGFDFWMLATETQSLVAMRMMNNYGLWPTAYTEKSRIFPQKPEAFGRAMMAATLAAASGNSLDQILNSAVEPLPKTSPQ